jgi:hypothetical protein
MSETPQQSPPISEKEIIDVCQVFRGLHAAIDASKGNATARVIGAAMTAGLARSVLAEAGDALKIRVTAPLRWLGDIEQRIIDGKRIRRENDWPKADAVLLELRTKAAKTKPAQRQPLGKNGRLLYRKLCALPEDEAMTNPEILDWFAGKKLFIDAGALTKDILPPLRPYGLKNTPRIGYSIPLADRPKKIIITRR